MTQNNSSATEVSAIQHWSMYGQKGQPPANRTKATDWKTTPFKKPTTSAWHLPVSKDDLPTLLNGFKPGAMEDKWFVYTDGPDDDGQATIHFHRSWTGYKVAEVRLVIDHKQKGKAGDEKISFSEIIWESDENYVRQTEAGAKETVVGVCQWCLDAKSLSEALSQMQEE